MRGRVKRKRVEGGRDIKIKNTFTSKTVLDKLSWNDNHSKTVFAKPS